MPDQWKKEKPADRPGQGKRARKGVRERERGKSPMVLPYGKSPTAMVNARIIGGRYAVLLWEAKK